MISTNSTNASAQTFNGYTQKPNASASSKEQPSFSLPAATAGVGVGLASGIPVGTYLKNRYEYNASQGYGKTGKHEFCSTADGQLEIRNLDSKGDIVNRFFFDKNGKLRASEQGGVKLNEPYTQISEKFDENGKRIEGIVKTHSFSFEVDEEKIEGVVIMSTRGSSTDQAIKNSTPPSGKVPFKIKEKEIDGGITSYIDLRTLGDKKDKALKELKPITLTDISKDVDVNYIHIQIQGPVATAEERLKDLPKDIPTQFKDVEPYLKKLQTNRTLVALGIGSGLGLLAYLGVAQLGKDKSKQPT